MSRPSFCRRVRSVPHVTLFKPQGIPIRELEHITLAVEELEALRLADLDGLYHEQAAEKMGVSRQTFGRIVEEARKKVADALVTGKALAINGGNFIMEGVRTFHCAACGHSWELPFGTGRPNECPQCHSDRIRRVGTRRGPGEHPGRGRGPCGQSRARFRSGNSQ